MIRESKTNSGYATLAGSLLIALGLLTALWAASTVFSIINDPQKISVFNEIIPDNPEVREIIVQNTRIILPEILFYSMAYGVFILLLFVMTAIAKLFITNGVTLVLDGRNKRK